jgi:hypothetical protein
MRALKNDLFCLLAILALGAFVYFILAGSEGGSPPGQTKDDQVPLRGDREIQDLDGEQSPRDREIGINPRDQAFLLKESGGDKTELYRIEWELAQESSSRFLTSKQTLDLVLSLDGRGVVLEAGTVRLRIKDLFESERIDELAGLLVQAITQTFEDVEGRYRSDMLGWGFLLGENGSGEEAQLFRGKIDGPWPLGDFLHGWNIARPGDDPLELTRRWLNC